METQECRCSPKCFGYGRLSAAKPDLTAAVQEEQAKDYWQQQLEPAGIAWGGFFCDTSAQGSQLFADRKQGGEVFALAETGDHVVVWQLDRAFRSAADGAAVIQALATISADSNVESLPHSPARHGGLRPLLGSRTAIAAKGGRRHFCDMSAGFCTPPEVASPQKNVFRRSFGQFPPRSVKFSCKKT